MWASERVRLGVNEGLLPFGVAGNPDGRATGGLIRRSRSLTPLVAMADSTVAKTWAFILSTVPVVHQSRICRGRGADSGYIPVILRISLAPQTRETLELPQTVMTLRFGRFRIASTSILTSMLCFRSVFWSCESLLYARLLLLLILSLSFFNSINSSFLSSKGCSCSSCNLRAAWWARRGSILMSTRPLLEIATVWIRSSRIQGPNFLCFEKSIRCWRLLRVIINSICWKELVAHA